MYHAWRGFNANKALKVMIVTGTGRGFTSGADVSRGGMGGPPEDPGATPGAASPAPRMLKAIVEKPVIAAVNGAAAGMGYVLALACDIRIASDRAIFHHVYLRRALVTSGETWYLPRIIGLGNAIYHVFMADSMEADEALPATPSVACSPPRRPHGRGHEDGPGTGDPSAQRDQIRQEGHLQGPEPDLGRRDGST